MDVEIICPLYNAENYIENLDKSIKKQKNVNIKKINYILTESLDKTEQILIDISAQFSIVKKEDFSHSLSREKVAMQSDSDVLVFITQDVDIRNNDWLEKLVRPIEKNEAECTFSRQLTKFNNIEKYTREKNYPNSSYTVSKNDVDKMGIKAFWISDASCAIKTKIYKKLNGYDGKRLPISEDMYIAYKIIMNGYKIKYCSDSIVYHSHNFTIREVFKRYYDTGRFFKQNSYLNKYNMNKAGGGLAFYILKRASQDKDIKVILRWLPDMGARYIGMKMGKFNGKKY